MSSVAQGLKYLEPESLPVLCVHLVPSWIVASCKERRVHQPLPFQHFLFHLVGGGGKLSYQRLLPLWAYAKPVRVAQTLFPFLPLYLFSVSWLDSTKRQLEQSVLPRAWREKIILIILSSILSSLREVAETLARSYMLLEETCTVSRVFSVRQWKQPQITDCRLKPHFALGQMHPCQK